MLNLNHEPDESANDHNDQTSLGLAVPSAPLLNDEGDPIWKVLVFDDLGRDVISSVLQVSDLRAWGVTMHMYAPTQNVGGIANSWRQAHSIHTAPHTRCSGSISG